MKKITFEEAIKALDEGKKVYCNISNYLDFFLKENGVYCYYQNNQKYVHNIKISRCRYFYLPEESKPFEITETGFYRTRGGEVVFVFDIARNSDITYPISGCIINGTNECWKRQGEYLEMGLTAKDLVELIKSYSEELLK